MEGVIDAAGIRFGRRRSLLIRLSDGTGSITLRFFHFSAAQKANLSVVSDCAVFGEVRNGPASFEIVHPEYQRIDDSGDGGVSDACLLQLLMACIS